MQALRGCELPSALAGTLRLLARTPWPRDATHHPHALEQCLKGVQLCPQWLHAYTLCTGAPCDPAGSVPPLAWQVAAAPLHMALMAHPAFPFGPLGVVHQEQALQQWLPIRPDARCDVQVMTGELREEKRGISIGIITEVRLADALACRSELRLLALGKPPPSPTSSLSRPPAPWTLLPHQTVYVPASMGRRYARIAADYNPVHLHALLARAFGFRRAMAHGTWTLATALARCGWPGPGPLSLHARFLHPVELPSTIRIRCAAGLQTDDVALYVTRSTDERLLLSARIHPAPP